MNITELSKVYFIPSFYKNENYVNSASARYRVIWPVKYMENASIWKKEDDVKTKIEQSECLFLQKICNQEIIEIAKYAKQLNKLVVLDLTDPIWEYNEYFNELYNFIDLIIVSSKELKKELKKIYSKKTICINEDGEDLNHYTLQKNYYSLLNRNLPIVVWTGMKDTYPNLYYALNILKPFEGQFKLKVIADYKPEFDFKNLEFIKWDLESVQKEYISSDFSINPRDPKIPRNKLKSNNKTNLSWVLGVPCIYKWKDEKKVINEFNTFLVSQESREVNAKKGRNKVLKFYNIERVVESYNYEISYRTGKISKYRFYNYLIKNYLKSLKYSY